MTPEQALQELRKEISLNERLAGLIRTVGESQEIHCLRSAYKTAGNHDAMVIAVASGRAVADFINLITADNRKPVEKPSGSALG